MTSRIRKTNRRDSEETKRKKSEAHKAYWAKRSSKAERREHGKKSAAPKKLWSEQKEREYRQHLAEGVKRHWASMSEADKKKFSEKHSVRMKAWYEDLSEETKIKIAVKVRESDRKSPNKIEKLLLEYLAPMGFEFVGDGKFWISRYNPDFVDRKHKIVIELFGRYWHKNRRDADTARVKMYSKCGWKIIILWDDVLIKNPRHLMQRVEKRLEELR